MLKWFGFRTSAPAVFLGAISAGYLLGVCPAISQSEQDAIDRAADAIMNDYQETAYLDIKKLCADDWPADFVMQKQCVDDSIAARAEAQTFDVMASTQNTIIWGTCLSRWSNEADLVNWVMANHCINEQKKAADALNN